MPGRHSALTIQMDALLRKWTIVIDSPQHGNPSGSSRCGLSIRRKTGRLGAAIT